MEERLPVQNTRHVLTISGSKTRRLVTTNIHHCTRSGGGSIRSSQPIPLRTFPKSFHIWTWTEMRVFITYLLPSNLLNPLCPPMFHCTSRAIAQAVSRLLLTTAARVRAQIRSWGIGVGFLRVFRFSLPILSPTAPHLSSVIRVWYNRLDSGRRIKWPQPYCTLRN
jgi:hypothetical protein